MRVDKRVIEPFNKWWREEKGQHCEPTPQVVASFAAGFKAGMERAVSEVTEIMKRPAEGKSGA